MSQSLRKSLDAMYDARIPERWLKISWESATLGFWYTELLERDHQFRQWCNHGRPKVFWMTGFFNPQGFLTAMRQVSYSVILHAQVVDFIWDVFIITTFRTLSFSLWNLPLLLPAMRYLVNFRYKSELTATLHERQFLEEMHK